jgi:acetyl esterase/lipase
MLRGRQICRSVNSFGLVLALFLSAPNLTAPNPTKVSILSYSELLARDKPLATLRARYGTEPDQFGDLWLPKEPGNGRVVVLIHGGCWLASLPGLELMAYVAEDLHQQGYAVWNVEYRRLGNAGGGYPGTFSDVAHAVDHLKSLAKLYALNLSDVIVAGHSAGGHLAIWAAARHRIAKTSDLYNDDPLPIKAAVSLAGINDLRAYRTNGPDACGGPETIDQLVGASDRQKSAVFSDTSPASLFPIGVRQAIVSGGLDPIVPPNFGQDYALAASAAGDPVEEITIADAGHFELIDPRSPAWTQIRSIIANLP